MTPQELKNSILQLAIQGKLVEQRPEEGNAEELYRQIQAEKQRLIKEGKINKEKPLPEISEDEKPFDIPETWIWARFGEMVSVKGGKRIPAGRTLTTVNTGHKYIRVSDMKNGSVLIDNIMYVPEDIYPSISKYIINTDDIYITVAGTIGKVGKIPVELDGSNLTENADKLSPFLLNQDWLIKCLESSVVQTQIADVTTKVGQPKLAIMRIQEIIIPLPPLAEQKRIVAKIEELLPYIDQYEHAWSKLEELNKRFPGDMQKSILQMAIQGKLVDQRPEEGTGEELYRQIQAEKQKLIKAGKIKKEKPLPDISEDEKPFDIPESWLWVRWGAISQSIQYGYNAPAQECGRIKMVRISDIQNGLVLWNTVPYCDIKEEDVETYLLKRNDILFARTGGTVGKSYLVKDIPEEAIYAGYLIRTSYSGLLCPEYMKHFMESQLYWTQLRNGTIATAQPNCNGQTLSMMILPLPPLAEQKRIVSRLEEILPLCEQLK
ncbi:MAG: restriction endonuclease subunit S [Aminipila sp.]